MPSFQTVSSQDFRSLYIFCHFSQLRMAIFSTAYFFLVKSQCSVNFHLTNFLFHFFSFTFLIKILIATYGAIVRGSVFKMEFIVLAKEFESIETSPGFAQLLGENWI